MLGKIKRYLYYNTKSMNTPKGARAKRSTPPYVNTGFSYISFQPDVLALASQYRAGGNGTFSHDTFCLLLGIFLLILNVMSVVALVMAYVVELLSVVTDCIGLTLPYPQRRKKSVRTADVHMQVNPTSGISKPKSELQECQADKSKNKIWSKKSEDWLNRRGLASRAFRTTSFSVRDDSRLVGVSRSELLTRLLRAGIPLRFRIVSGTEYPFVAEERL